MKKMIYTDPIKRVAVKPREDGMTEEVVSIDFDAREDLSEDKDRIWRNSQILLKGLEGTKCVEVRKATIEEFERIVDLTPLAFAPGSVMVYSNGALNMSFRDISGKVVGVVRVRP